MEMKTELAENVENMLAERKPVTNVTNVIREIDVYLGQTFDAMSVIDESYGRISSFFVNMSNQVVGERDFNKLSENEQKEAMLYMAASLAVQGVCTVTKGIKETIALEKVKRLHRQVAEARRESLPRQIERVRRCHDEAAVSLMRHNGHPFKASDLKDSFNDTAGILETELCLYRDARFRLDMLLWIKDEYDAWMEGRLYSDTPMPTMGQATIAAIYLLAGNNAAVDRFTPEEQASQIVLAAQPPVCAANRNADLRSFGEELSKGLNRSSFNGEDRSFSAFEILAVIDNQMSAVLERFSLDENPLDGDGESDEEDYIDIDGLTCGRLYANIYMNSNSYEFPFIRKALEENEQVLKSMKSLEAFYDMKAQCDRGHTMAIINGLLMSAVAILPVWTFNLEWYWAACLSVVILIFVLKWLTASSVQGISDNFLNKYLMMNRNYEYNVVQDAGLTEPESKLREMARSRNHFWAGLIIGGIVGMILGPIGAIIGAVLGAMLGSGSSDDSDDHGKDWETIKIYKPTKQWILMTVTAIVLLLEIFGLFFAE